LVPKISNAMLFNSYVFLFAFLPIALVGFFVLGGRELNRAAAAWLIGASLFFYGWWNPVYLPLIIGSVVFNYWAGVMIANAVSTGRSRRARRLLWVGVSANLVLLGYCKYANFLVENANALLGTHWHLDTIALPLAISFFTFTQIAYLTDAFHGVTKNYDFLYYSLFVTFFPHLIAGPIVLYRKLMPQFARPVTYRFNPSNFAYGLTLSMMGLAKKVVIADQLAPVADHVFGCAAHGVSIGAVTAWVGAVAYSLQLYFDFSGYSDMAIGFARMFNTTFPVNFDSPYKARDIIDFWRRWHITLSTFLRDHLYIPLGGNRCGSLQRYKNLFVTMLLGGLWHGAGWTFVIWGGLHGLYLIVNHAWLHLAKSREWTATWPMKTGGYLLTLIAIIVGWVFFRAGTVTNALSMISAMAGLRGGMEGHVITSQRAAMLSLSALIALFAPNTNELFRLGEPARETFDQPKPLWILSPLTALITAFVTVVAVLHLSHISGFLYFQF